MAECILPKNKSRNCTFQANDARSLHTYPRREDTLRESREESLRESSSASDVPMALGSRFAPLGGGMDAYLGASMREHIRKIVQQELQYELLDIRDKMAKFAVDLQVLEVCAMTQQHSSGSSGSKVPPISGMVSVTAAQCEARLNHVEEKMKELSIAQRTAARMANDFRSQLDTIGKRQVKLQNNLIKELPLASRFQGSMATCAMPLVAVGGDIGPSLLTGRVDSIDAEGSTRRSKWSGRKIDFMPRPAWEDEGRPAWFASGEDYFAAKQEYDQEFEKVQAQLKNLKNPTVGHDGKLVEQVD